MLMAATRMQGYSNPVGSTKLNRRQTSSVPWCSSGYLVDSECLNSRSSLLPLYAPAKISKNILWDRRRKSLLCLSYINKLSPPKSIILLDRFLAVELVGQIKRILWGFLLPNWFQSIVLVLEFLSSSISSFQNYLLGTLPIYLYRL